VARDRRGCPRCRSRGVVVERSDEGTEAEAECEHRTERDHERGESGADLHDTTS
jgi:hypothetical protein